MSLVACVLLSLYATIMKAAQSARASSKRLRMSDKRKFDPKRRATVIPIFCRYHTVVRFNNGARDGQPHAHTLDLTGEKRFEDLRSLFLWECQSRDPKRIVGQSSRRATPEW